MLFDSFSVKGLTLKNRIVMPPMCNYMSDRAGLANDWHFIHYASRAIGGAGLIIQEATGVEDGGRISARDLGLWTDEQGEASKRIVDIVHRHGAKIGVQLNHAGRKSEVEYLHPVGPSAVAFSDKSRTPQELTKAEIAAIVDKFAAAAKRAVAAGYDVIEIHGAHGYLINQFLSPLSNQRRDEYGGGLITEPVQAEQVIKTGVDLVFLGRELLREPYWPLRAAFVLGQETAWPEPYVRGKFL